MWYPPVRRLGALGCLAILVACDGGAGSGSDGSGGTGTGGSGVRDGAAGSQGTGGSIAGTGGGGAAATGSGGAQGTGGVQGTGGAQGTGGSQGTGGGAGAGGNRGGGGGRGGGGRSGSGQGGGAGATTTGGTGAAGGAAGTTALSFAADIWPVFDKVRQPVFVYRGMGSYESCTTNGVCHGGTNPGARLSMADADTAYRALVNTTSVTSLCAVRNATVRVVPGDPDRSCLIAFYQERLKDDLQWVDQAEIDLVRAWIAQGARP